jgi:glyoxylase I family protein
MFSYIQPVWAMQMPCWQSRLVLGWVRVALIEKLRSFDWALDANAGASLRAEKVGAFQRKRNSRRAGSLPPLLTITGPGVVSVTPWNGATAENLRARRPFQFAISTDNFQLIMLCLLAGASMTSLQLTQIDHVSVIITNVSRSRSFYRDLLGLPEIAKPKTFDFVALWFDLGNGQTLHLLRKDAPDSISPRHFCLRVTDAKSAREYFRQRGVAIQETTLIPGADRFFIFDPDGNRIELLQWLEPYDPAVSGAAKLDQ